MFQIEIDARRRFVSIVVNGMLDDAEAADYVTTIREKFACAIGFGPYVMMIDTRRCNLQTQSVVATFAQHIASFPKASKIALVNGDSIARMQLRRFLTRDYSRFFDDDAEALDWLFPQDAGFPPSERPAPVARAY